MYSRRLQHLDHSHNDHDSRNTVSLSSPTLPTHILHSFRHNHSPAPNTSIGFQQAQQNLISTSAPCQHCPSHTNYSVPAYPLPGSKLLAQACLIKFPSQVSLSPLLYQTPSTLSLPPNTPLALGETRLHYPAMLHSFRFPPPCCFSTAAIRLGICDS